jgi:DnaK suppressor protein
VTQRRDEWDEADARGEVAPKPVFAKTKDGGWAVVSLSPEQLVGARKALAERRAQLESDLGSIEVAEQRDEPRPQYGKRIGDHTNEAVETRRNAAAADTLRLQLAETQRALAKLDEGSYGRCDSCGGPIGAERLAALPWAAECIDCRSGRSGHGRQIRHRWP